MKKIFQIIFLFVIVTSVTEGANGDIPTVRNGVLDLREQSIDWHCLAKLDGEWEFYWDLYVYPQDFLSHDAPLPDTIVSVPSYWTAYTLNGKELPGQGKGTYRMKLLLPKGFRNKLTFDIPSFDAAFKMYMDGKIVAQAGKTGTSSLNSEAAYKPGIIDYTPVKDSIEIIIHLSNYQHRRGGIWRSIQMGNHDKIHRLTNQKTLVGQVSQGIVFAFALLFFIFFLLMKEDKTLLWFSLSMAGIFFRFIATGNYPIQLVSQINWNWLIRMEYMGTFAAFIFGMWYFKAIFKSRAFNLFTQTNTTLTLAAVVLILFTKPGIFTYTMLYFQPMVIVFLLLVILVTFFRVFTEMPGRMGYFAASLVLIVAILNDIFIANSKSAISQEYLSQFAMLAFVFIQAVLLIKKWVSAYHETKILHAEIAHINLNLESIVEKRTAQLEEQNLKISRQNEKIEEQNKSLQDSLDFKNKFFSIIAHDLKSPIASLVQVWNLMDEDFDAEEKLEIFASAKDLVHSASTLIENLLYWGRSQGNQIQQNPSELRLRTTIEESAKLHAEAAKQKSIRLNVDCEPDCLVYVDRELIQIMFRNLISNAIKFTSPGGKVTISASRNEQNEEMATVRVIDNGLGMAGDVLQNIRNNMEIKSTAGTANERGTGLGLRLCLDLVKINNGNMEIESIQGIGTTIIISLPRAKKE